jgi:glutamyl-tRNA reductase
MNIGLLKIDYKTASLNQLEQLYFKKEKLPTFLSAVQENSDISEMVVVSTCNRVEVYFRATDIPKSKQWIAHYIQDQRGIPDDTINILTKDDLSPNEVIWHLFRVASGIESMVFGEGEILTQIKSAYELSAKVGMTKPSFNKLFQSTIAAGKRVRAETDIAKGSYSVSSIAIEAVRKHFKDQFSEKKILIVGAGTMGLRALKKLSALAHAHLFITNRSDSKLSRILTKYHATHIPYSELSDHLPSMDAVIWATSSDTYLIDHTHLTALSKYPEVMVDLGIPRNVNPTVEQLPNIHLYTIYGLQKIADETIENRRAQLQSANAILKEEFEKLTSWHTHRTAIAGAVPKHD